MHDRKTEEIVTALGQRISNFLDTYEKDQLNTGEWRKAFEDKLIGMETSVGKLMVPYKVVVAVLSLSGVAFATEAARRIIQYIYNHFR